MQAVADRDGHQLVPGRVEVDLVDPVAPCVVRAQHWPVDVRQPGMLLGAGGAGQPSELVQLAGDPVAALPAHGREQRVVVGDVVAR